MGDPTGDAAGKFTWLRQFDIYTCNANCVVAGVVNDAAFTKRYTSPRDAFPGDQPWPVTPQAQIRSFAIPTTHGEPRAAARRLEPVHRAAAVPGRAGQRSGEPDRLPDVAASRSSIGGGSWMTTAAELQVFGGTGGVGGGGGGGGGPKDPVVALTKDGPEVAKPGSTVSYNLSYTQRRPCRRFERTGGRHAPGRPDVPVGLERRHVQPGEPDGHVVARHRGRDRVGHPLGDGAGVAAARDGIGHHEHGRVPRGRDGVAADGDSDDARAPVAMSDRTTSGGRRSRAGLRLLLGVGVRRVALIVNPHASRVDDETTAAVRDGARAGRRR